MYHVFLRNALGFAASFFFAMRSEEFLSGDLGQVSILDDHRQELGTSYSNSNSSKSADPQPYSCTVSKSNIHLSAFHKQ